MLIFTADVIHLASNMSVVASCGGWRARCSASAAWPVVMIMMMMMMMIIIMMMTIMELILT